MEGCAAAAKTALTRAAHELRTNEELHKGVEFGARAAAEVSKYAAEKVWDDVQLNIWDSALAKGFGGVGLHRAAAVLEEPALTLPVNNLIGAKNVVDAVWGGGSHREAEELGRHIYDVYDQVCWGSARWITESSLAFSSGLQRLFFGSPRCFLEAK